MNFFFDNNLAPKLAHGLNQLVAPERLDAALRAARGAAFVVTVNGKIEG